MPGEDRLTIKLPPSLKQQIQEVADEQTNGNLSAWVKWALASEVGRERAKREQRLRGEEAA